jgi:hypothetical protein
MATLMGGLKKMIEMMCGFKQQNGWSAGLKK